MTDALGNGKVVGGSAGDPYAKGYTPFNFYIAATDGHGHSGVVRWNLGRSPDSLVAMMRQVVDDPRTPYRTVADLARDAIYHRIKWLNEQVSSDPLFGQEWAKYHQLQEELAEQERVLQRQDGLDIQLAGLLARKDYEGLRGVIRAVRGITVFGDVEEILDRYEARLPADERKDAAGEHSGTPPA